jgi:hypothetical protein
MEKHTLTCSAPVNDSKVPKKLHKLTGMQTPKLSKKTFALSEEYLAKLSRDKTQQQYTGIVNLVGENMTRGFLQVEIGGTSYWADAITGSLYNSEGQCKTSTRLLLVGEPWPVAGDNKSVDLIKRAA